MVLLLACYFTLKFSFAPDGDMFTDFDGRLDAKQLQAIQTAKHAVARQPESFDARYSFFQNQRRYTVIVWRVTGYDWFLNPKFVPGGYPNVELDKNLKVIRITGGL